jgi:spermidine synthase
VEALNPYFGYFYTVKRSLQKRTTRFQNLQLIDTDELGKVLVIDDITQVAEKNDAYYHEPMVHPALCSHPKPEHVLVIGGGDGGILREVLKYPCVKSVELAELDDGVIGFSKKHMPALSSGAFDDPRLRIVVTEGRHYTEKNRGRYDIVIMDMTDPSGPSRMLYTREFFGAVRRSFRNKNGIFVMHTESPVTRPKGFSCIQRTLRESFLHVTPFYLFIQMYGTMWSVTMCSDSIDGSRLAARIDARIAKNRIGPLRVYSGATHGSMQVPFPFIRTLLAADAPIITDAKPDFPDDFIAG